MTEILQNSLPAEMGGAPALPGVAPCEAEDWLRVDEAYAGQMARRIALLESHEPDVLWCAPAALGAAREVLGATLAFLPELGFKLGAGQIVCPDGREVTIDYDRPLWTLGHLVQEDICILQKQGDQHVLTAAVLCFPASWKLSDKVGRPLTDIHVPVAEYDGDLARRVQRLFDGVQVGRPLWRFNKLAYGNAELHQPVRIAATGLPEYVRSERQCIVRMPQSDAVVFSIHTWVVRS
ncbi:Protein of unknown function [Sulfitobacter brevis]|uniref:DUF3445 domain-containing protein n=1 Tax=Sulfitobacter brevis TaxID=74348 RepID=A0A1I2EQD8_9RHOB|nr:DUF3445 domain-containing protein [Sulfitobacter brevis]SFE94847.1 Protein of unknown function [Sulfitobacter brevis]